MLAFKGCFGFLKKYGDSRDRESSAFEVWALFYQKCVTTPFLHHKIFSLSYHEKLTFTIRQTHISATVHHTMHKLPLFTALSLNIYIASCFISATDSFGKGTPSHVFLPLHLFYIINNQISFNNHSAISYTSIPSYVYFGCFVLARIIFG